MLNPAADRSDHFNAAAWAKRTLRTLASYRRERRQALRLQKALEALGLARADLVLLRTARTLPILPDLPAKVEEIAHQAAATLYRVLDWAQVHCADHEQAALLGTDHRIIAEARRTYGREQVLTLLATGAHPRIDPDLTTALSLFVIQEMTNHPVLHRRTVAALNDCLGTDFDLPAVPRPRLVKS